MLEPPRTSAVGEGLVQSLTTSLQKFRYSRTTPNSVKQLYTPCYLCSDVVREGSKRFDVLEPWTDTVDRWTDTVHALILVHTIN